MHDTHHLSACSSPPAAAKVDLYYISKTNPITVVIKRPTGTRSANMGYILKIPTLSSLRCCSEEEQEQLVFHPNSLM